MAIKTFTTGEVLTAADTNTYLANSGLVFVSSTTVGSGVASVTISNCFSATFDAYKVVMTNVKNNTNDYVIKLQLNNATTVGYYGSYQYVNYGTNTFAVASDTNASSFTYAGACGTGNNFGGVLCEILNPFITGFTRFVSGPVTYQNITGTYTAIQDGNLSHTGFNIIAGAGTFTGGTITVYGYRKA